MYCIRRVNNNQRKEIGKNVFKVSGGDVDEDARVHPPNAARKDVAKSVATTRVLDISRYAVRMVADELDVGATTVYSI